MLRRLSHWLIVGALVFTIGAHWALLQSVAWIGMTFSYAHDSTLTEALAKTFGGLHPCKLCKVVQEGQKSERKQQAQKPIEKFDLFCLSDSGEIKPPVLLQVPTAVFGPIAPLGEPPPKPPPRPCFQGGPERGILPASV